MDVPTVNPTRRRYGDEVVTEVNKYVNEVPLCETVCLTVIRSLNKAIVFKTVTEV